MIGTTLGEIRQHIELLASETGTYYLVCGRTHDRPVPADGLYFESRAVARAAARATEQYRATLRRYDPQVPYYDVIVREKLENAPSPAETRWLSIDAIDGDGGGDGDGSRDGDSSRSPAQPTDSRSMIDFCHTVAGVVFETIAASSSTGLETAIMDTYFDVAETIDHPDELCLQLLESIATELDARRDPDEQATLLAAAAADFPAEPVRDPARDDPLEGTLAELQSVGLLDTYRIERCPPDQATGSSWTVRLAGYALGSTADRIVTLPIVVELFRRLPTRSLTITDAERVTGSVSATWRLTVTTATTDRSRGLACLQEGSHA